MGVSKTNTTGMTHSARDHSEVDTGIVIVRFDVFQVGCSAAQHSHL